MLGEILYVMDYLGQFHRHELVVEWAYPGLPKGTPITDDEVRILTLVPTHLRVARLKALRATILTAP